MRVGTDCRWRSGSCADGWAGLGQGGHGGGQRQGRVLVGFAGSDLLLVFVLLHQAFSFVDGFDLLLQRDVRLSGLLCTRHAARVTVPRHLHAHEGFGIKCTE